MGVIVLELTYDPTKGDLPVTFALLAVSAGIAVGWGCWSAASLLDRRLGRFGMRAVAACSATFGLGLGLDLLPALWIGFFLAYSVGLFVLPGAFAILGFGVMRSVVYPTWGSWVSFAVSGVAVTTYGFHALARQTWDPPDWVWFVTLGVGWISMGVAIARMRPDVPASQEAVFLSGNAQIVIPTDQ
jgi:hypothetical protein